MTQWDLPIYPSFSCTWFKKTFADPEKNVLVKGEHNHIGWMDHISIHEPAVLAMHPHKYHQVLSVP